MKKRIVGTETYDELVEYFTRKYLKGGKTRTMAKSIRENAKNYVSKQTKNIAELKSVPVDLILEEGKGKDQYGKEFTYNFITIDGEEYRVPDKVLKDLKAILEKKPSLRTFSVSRQGTGLNTTYTVIPLE